MRNILDKKTNLPIKHLSQLRKNKKFFRFVTKKTKYLKYIVVSKRVFIVGIKILLPKMQLFVIIECLLYSTII